MEKSKCTPAARASKKIILPDPRWVSILIFDTIQLWWRLLKFSIDCLGIHCICKIKKEFAKMNYRRSRNLIIDSIKNVFNWLSFKNETMKGVYQWSNAKQSILSCFSFFLISHSISISISCNFVFHFRWLKNQSIEEIKLLCGKFDENKLNFEIFGGHD